MKKHHKQRLAKLAITFLDRLELHVGEPDRYALRVDEDREMWFNMKSMCIMENWYSAMPSQVISCGTSCCLLGFSPVAFPEEIGGFETWMEAARYLIGVSDGWRWDFLFSEQWSSDPLFTAMRCLAMIEHEQKSMNLMDEMDATGCVDEDDDGWAVGVLDYIDTGLMLTYKAGKVAIKNELIKHL